MSIVEIKEKISPVLRAYGIKKASVFGSVSRGEDHPDSDVDLLIIVGSTNVPPHKRARPVYKALRRFPVPAEISIVTKDEFARRVKWIVSAERDAFEKGKILYEHAA